MSENGQPRPSFSGEAQRRPENLDQEMLGSSPSMTARPRRFRKLKIAAGALAVSAMAGATALVLYARSLPPLDLSAAADRSTVVLDREGRLLRPFLTADGRWKLPVTSEDVDRAISPCSGPSRTSASTIITASTR